MKAKQQVNKNNAKRLLNTRQPPALEENLKLREVFPWQYLETLMHH